MENYKEKYEALLIRFEELKEVFNSENCLTTIIFLKQFRNGTKQGMNVVKL